MISENHLPVPSPGGTTIHSFLLWGISMKARKDTLLYRARGSTQPGIESNNTKGVPRHLYKVEFRRQGRLMEDPSPEGRGEVGVRAAERVM